VAERRSASKRLGFEHRSKSSPGDGQEAGPDAGPASAPR
jgi:hypothetical protein